MHPVVGVHEVWALRERVRACAEPPRATLSASWGARSVRAESPPPPLPTVATTHVPTVPRDQCALRGAGTVQRAREGGDVGTPPPRLPSLLLPLPMSPLYT